MNKTPYLFTSAEASQALMASRLAAEDVNASTQAWPRGFATLNRLKAPLLRPGQIMVIQGCPGEGKTALKDYLISCQNKSLMERGAEGVILNLVLEQTIEESRAITMSDPLNYHAAMKREISLDDVMRKIVNSAGDRILYIGHPENGESIHPDAASFYKITPQQFGELGHQAWKMAPVSMAAIDYLQLMNDNARSADPTIRVSNTSDQIVDIGKNVLRCPLIIPAQSDVKGLKSRNNKIPQGADIQQSSRIYQDAYVMLGVWLPIVDLQLYSSIDVNRHKIPVLRDLLVVKINKWKKALGLSGQEFVMSFGKPFGDMYEPDLSILSRVDPMKLMAEGIEYLWQIQEHHYK